MNNDGAASDRLCEAYRTGIAQGSLFDLLNWHYCAGLCLVLFIASLFLPATRTRTYLIDRGGSIFSDRERESFRSLDSPMLQAAYAQVDAQTYRPSKWGRRTVKTDAWKVQTTLGLSTIALIVIWRLARRFRLGNAARHVREAIEDLWGDVVVDELPLKSRKRCGFLIRGQGESASKLNTVYVSAKSAEISPAAG